MKTEKERYQASAGGPLPGRGGFQTWLLHRLGSQTPPEGRVGPGAISGWSKCPDGCLSPAVHQNQASFSCQNPPNTGKLLSQWVVLWRPR